MSLSNLKTRVILSIPSHVFTQTSDHDCNHDNHDLDQYHGHEDLHDHLLAYLFCTAAVFYKRFAFFQVVFNIPDNLDGDVLAIAREILPELNTILEKTRFYPCRLLFPAALLSFVSCLIGTVISLYIFGRLALKLSS